MTPYFSPPSTRVGALLIVLVLSLFVIIILSSENDHMVQATTSECRYPKGNVNQKRKGAVLALAVDTLHQEIESQLLSHVFELQEQALTQEGRILNDEDLEFTEFLEQELIDSSGQVTKSLFRRRLGRRLRRLGRRLKRVVRRVTHGVGRVGRRFKRGFRSFGRRFRRLRRRFGRGLRRLGRRLGRRIGRGLRRLGRRLGRGLRRFGRVVRQLNSALVKTVKAVVKVLKTVLKEVTSLITPKAKEIVASSVPKFTGATGPTNKVMENRTPFKGLGGECVSCRVDCMKVYPAAGGSLFSKCSKRFHYYGCQLVAPCMHPSTATDSEIEGMIGICVVRNGCELNQSVWGEITWVNAKHILQTVIGRVRASGVSTE
ncbi:hypothetical protein FDP41_000343 [Naegleria fowleri]|uniref:Uncharacterized protein n=1 Tax=Naegleria fowleri TaxID=5763 RepID=A0A6A5CD12_NAEFO|nr:uncharacterized protein FDP41_000343 [Naegleria fowleri]KAF0984444.1 hypothetical protein FDP41_000343 [Naegleria fowleri]